MPRSNSTTWAVWNAITAARLEDINEDIDNLYSTGSDKLKIYIATGLNVNIWSGAWRVWSSSGIYAGWVVAMTASATNYVMINSSGTIVVSTSAWDDNNGRLGIVVTGASTITSITIWRPDVVGGTLGGGLTVWVSATAPSQSLNTWGTPVKVTFNTEDFDVSSNYDNVTNYRFTAPSVWYYEISAYAEISSNSTGQNCNLYIYKNGSAFKTMTSTWKGAGYREILSARYILSLAASDYIEVFAAQQASGNTATLQAWANLTINKL